MTKAFRRISFFVAGVPTPQGDMRAFVIPGTNRAILSHKRPKPLKSWRTAIADAARAATPKGAKLFEGALRAEFTFSLVSPKSRPAVMRTERQIEEWQYPWRRPDFDKLTRAACDALKAVIYRDDGQIVEAHINKRYAEDGNIPGVHVVIETMHEPETEDE